MNCASGAGTTSGREAGGNLKSEAEGHERRNDEPSIMKSLPCSCFVDLVVSVSGLRLGRHYRTGGDSALSLTSVVHQSKSQLVLMKLE